MSEIKLTADTFQSEVLCSDRPVLIDFWATWCGPCKMIAPIVDELEGEMPDVKFCKINVDDQPDLARLFKVQSIPTIAVVKNNTFLDMSVGYAPKEKLAAFINEYRKG